VSLRERAQETLYLLTRDWSATRLRKVARLLPADVSLAAENFAIEFLPGVAQEFTDEMTKTNVSIPYEFYEIAKGRELAENESINEVKTSENQ
jgi:hypothetical protein